MEIQNLDANIMNTLSDDGKDPLWMRQPVTEEVARVNCDLIKTNEKAFELRDQIPQEAREGKAFTLRVVILTLMANYADKMENWEETAMCHEISMKLRDGQVAMDLPEDQEKFIQQMLFKAEMHSTICSKFIEECFYGRRREEEAKHLLAQNHAPKDEA